MSGEESAKKLIRCVTNALTNLVQHDEVFRDEILSIIRDSTEDKPKRKTPDTKQKHYMSMFQGAYRKMGARYSLPMGVVAKILKDWDYDMKSLGQLLRDMNARGMLDKPPAYQIKVINSTLASGKKLDSPKSSRSHVRAGGNEDNIEDLRALEDE